MEKEDKMRKKDIDILKRFLKGGKLHYQKYLGWFNPRPYYFFDDDLYKIPAHTMDRLLKKGWIQQVGNNFQVTEKGLTEIRKTSGDANEMSHVSKTSDCEE